MRNKVVTLYLPTEADVKRWHALAKAKSCSLSSWVFETIELSLENRPPPKPTTDSEELARLKKENSDLKTEIEQIKRLNVDLRLSRAANAFLATHKVVTLEDKVKEVLQGGKTWTGQELAKRFTLDLIGGGQDLQTLNKLLRRLIDQGEIEEVVGGFRWKGKN